MDLIGKWTVKKAYMRIQKGGKIPRGAKVPMRDFKNWRWEFTANGKLITNLGMDTKEEPYIYKPGTIIVDSQDPTEPGKLKWSIENLTQTSLIITTKTQGQIMVVELDR